MRIEFHFYKQKHTYIHDVERTDRLEKLRKRCKSYIPQITSFSSILFEVNFAIYFQAFVPFSCSRVMLVVLILFCQSFVYLNYNSITISINRNSCFLCTTGISCARAKHVLNPAYPSAAPNTCALNYCYQNFVSLKQHAHVLLLF